MGFRSTLVTSDNYINWPTWFREKYQSSLFFNDAEGPFASRTECKFYGVWDNLAKDIQKAVSWKERDSAISFVYFHECGGITKCKITQEEIIWSEPTGWQQTPGVMHNYCYGCSEVA